MEKHKEPQVGLVINRAITAWMAAVLLWVMVGDGAFLTTEYAAQIHTIGFFAVILLVFVILNLPVKNPVVPWVDRYGILILFLLYAGKTIDKNKDFTYFIGVMLVLMLILAYTVNQTGDGFRNQIEIRKNRTVIAIYVVAASVYLLIAGGTTILNYLLYYAPAYDFGIWVQMFHYMKETLQPLTTVERSQLLSHFAVHFSPIYYVYLPFYLLFPNPVTLQVLQVITAASGIIPVYLLCKRRGLGKRAAAVFGVLFALYPAIAGGCYFDMHENCFLLPFLLWIFYFMETENWKGIVLFSVLTMLIKEDTPVYIACIGLYLALSKKKYGTGLFLTGLAVFVFGLTVSLMNQFGLGVMTYRYDNYASGDAGGLGMVIKTFLTNPAYALTQCITADKIKVLLALLLPLGFLPLLTKDIARYVLFLPIILVNLASDYSYQYSMFHQYMFGTSAILIYLAILNYSELTAGARRYLGMVGLCGSLLIMPFYSLSRSYYWKTYQSQKTGNDTLNLVMDSIPQTASVSASAYFVPHLADRDVIYEYPGFYSYTDLTDYIVLDLRFYEVTEEDELFFEENGYEVIGMEEKLYMVLNRQHEK